MMNNPDQVLAACESLCPQCLQRIPAFYVQRPDAVYLVKTCRQHGTFDTPVWRDGVPFSTWARYKTAAQVRSPFTAVERGCPYDCGICPAHRQHTCTALIEVTQRCNLQCSYCFASSYAGKETDVSLDTIRFMYRRLLESGAPCNVQLSGGEPTLRDDLPHIVAMGRSLGFEFIQLNTNGLRLAQDYAYLERLKEAGLSSIFLQFDGVNDEIYRRMRGADLQQLKECAVEYCAALDIGVVLVPTLVPGVNVQQIGAILRFAMQHIPAVRGVHFQPVSYFGRYPRTAKLPRLTIPEIICEIEDQSDGMFTGGSFKPPGCENALCSFHGNFVQMEDGSFKALTRHDPHCCYPTEEGARGAARSRRFVAHHWSSPPAPPENGARSQGGFSLGAWEELLERSRSHAFSISGMAFQDAWTLDLERLRDCCIHVVSPDGRLVPFCAYNLTALDGRTLYRSLARHGEMT